MIHPHGRSQAEPQVGIRFRRFLDPAYYETFAAILARSPELLDECFRLRYRVYCLERRFESPAAHPHGRETDAYDSISGHALLRYRRTGETVGTVRLVPGAAGKLPMYALLESAGIGTARLPAVERTAEISRFAVSNEFRRRLGDALYGKPVDDVPDGRRVIPHLTLGLMAMALRMGRQRGVEFFCAVMEPSLIRLLARFGMRWQTVGPLLDYHGLRQSCFARIEDMLATIAAERPDIYELLIDPRFCGETGEACQLH